jgi:DNA helicase-2/ATP-dependent DNA helicase PcrA
MEEGIFPGSQSLYSEEDLEEERRLAYVGITRAREKLYLVSARQRMLYGTTNRNMQSRFIGEIPVGITEDKTVKQQNFGSSSGGYMSHFGTPAKPHKYSRSTPIDARQKQSSSVTHIFGQVSNDKPQTAKVDYKVGDTVRHKSFGTGVIISAQPMGNDVLMEIAFDKAGTKKVMANFAKLEKV